MKFVDVVENLQEKNPGTIILAKNGIFFVAIGKDAIVLSNEIGLKRTCMKEGLCKVGFLVKTSEKYIELMKEKELSFALFLIDTKTGKIEELCRNTSKLHQETRSSLECEECTNKKETDEEVLERLKNIGK